MDAAPVDAVEQVRFAVAVQIGEIRTQIIGAVDDVFAFRVQLHLAFFTRVPVQVDAAAAVSGQQVGAAVVIVVAEGHGVRRAFEVLAVGTLYGSRFPEAGRGLGRKYQFVGVEEACFVSDDQKGVFAAGGFQGGDGGRFDVLSVCILYENRFGEGFGAFFACIFISPDAVVAANEQVHDAVSIPVDGGGNAVSRFPFPLPIDGSSRYPVNW